MAHFPPANFTAKSGEPIVVRTAQSDDADNILAFAKRIFETSEYVLTEPDEFNVTAEDERKWVESIVKSPSRILLLAETGSAIVGMLDFQNGSRRRISHTGVLGMSVGAEHRGKGIGSFLLGRLIEWASASPLIERVELSVFSPNGNAIRLYEKFGFREEGRKTRGIRLSKDLYLDEILMCRFVK